MGWINYACPWCAGADVCCTAGSEPSGCLQRAVLAAANQKPSSSDPGAHGDALGTGGDYGKGWGRRVGAVFLIYAFSTGAADNAWQLAAVFGGEIPAAGGRKAHGGMKAHSGRAAPGDAGAHRCREEHRDIKQHQGQLLARVTN